MLKFTIYNHSTAIGLDQLLLAIPKSHSTVPDTFLCCARPETIKFEGKYSQQID